jgi:hypothetical protein
MPPPVQFDWLETNWAAGERLRWARSSGRPQETGGGQSAAGCEPKRARGHTSGREAGMLISRWLALLFHSSSCSPAPPRQPTAATPAHHQQPARRLLKSSFNFHHCKSPLWFEYFIGGPAQLVRHQRTAQVAQRAGLRLRRSAVGPLLPESRAAPPRESASRSRRWPGAGRGPRFCRLAQLANYGPIWAIWPRQPPSPGQSDMPAGAGERVCARSSCMPRRLDLTGRVTQAAQAGPGAVPNRSAGSTQAGRARMSRSAISHTATSSR